jgi:hypothetical protein
MQTIYVVQKDILDYHEETEKTETVVACDTLQECMHYIDKLSKNSTYTTVKTYKDDALVGGLVIECVLSTHITHQLWIQEVEHIQTDATYNKRQRQRQRQRA